MTRRLPAALSALIRLVLVLALACSPLAQPMALAALAAPQPAGLSSCPHHSKAAQVQAGSQQPKPGECCFKKGSQCHCAMAVALPTAALPDLVPASSEHPVSVPHLAASLLPTPEPPPPRG